MIQELIEKYGTANPFKLADSLLVDYKFVHLPNRAKGMVIRNSYHEPMILINSKLEHSNSRYVVMAHELKHAISHFDLPDFYSSCYMGKGKCEREADIFATKLMYHLFIEQQGRPPRTFDELKQVYDVKESMRDVL